MQVKFKTSTTDVRLDDTKLATLIGGENKFEDFLNLYLLSLVTALQRDIEIREDLLIGDYEGVLMLEDSYKDYPFPIVVTNEKDSTERRPN